MLIACSYSQSSYNLSKEDYVIINVFLEQIEPFAYLNLSIKNGGPSDSTLLLGGYEKKVKLYNSFRNLCLQSLDKNEPLKYETNVSCSTADKLKVYDSLFTDKELNYFSKLMLKSEKAEISIEPKKILIPTISPIKEDVKGSDLVLKIYAIYYSKDRNKVLINYSISGRNLFHVLKKENGWWKNIINFDA